MCEPGFLCPHSSGNLYRFIQGEVRVVFLLLQGLNNQVFNALQFFNRFFGNLAQVGDVGKVPNAESIAGQGVMLQFYGDEMQIAKVERCFIKAMDVVGWSTRIRMLIKSVGILTFDFGQCRIINVKCHRLLLFENKGTQVVKSTDMILMLVSDKHSIEFGDVLA